MNPRLKADALAILAEAIEAAQPRTCIPEILQSDRGVLAVRADSGAFNYELRDFRRILLVGAGKAAVSMAGEVVKIVGSDRISHGVLVTKYGHGQPGVLPGHLEVMEAGHPEPDEAGLAGARKTRDLLQSAGRGDLVIVVLSGGGSSLWPLPPLGISVDEKRRISRFLLSCGASIHETNAVRKHVSAIKGGLAARLAHPAQVLVIAISDVIGDDLSVIASGPFAPDPTTFNDAWKVVHRYGLERRIPRSIYDHLRKGIMGEIWDTPKPGEVGVFDKVRHVICASNRLSLDRARDKAEGLGYKPLVIADDLSGDIEEACSWWLRKIGESAAGERQSRVCLIAGGETTVKLSEGHGKGGRNQELALRMAQALAGRRDVVFLSAGTDGTDGPTDAAGGIVDGGTVDVAAELGVSVARALEGHSSYDALSRIGGLLTTGPTGTNVMDVQIFLQG